VFADAHLKHIISARRLRQAESGAREVSPALGANLREVRRMYVVSHDVLSIDRFAIDL